MATRTSGNRRRRARADLFDFLVESGEAAEPPSAESRSVRDEGDPRSSPGILTRPPEEEQRESSPRQLKSRAPSIT